MKILPTPIYDAMAELNLDNVKILVNANANANTEQTDYRQYKPTLYAANMNQWHIVYYLLEQGANYKQIEQWEKA